MIIKSIDPTLPDQTIIEFATRYIKGGGVVVFPSDSSYGLAADISNKEAVDRLFKIKGRPYDKRVSCIFKDISQIEQWTDVGKRQKRTLERNLPGPFTFLLSPRVAYPAEGETVGVRIPDNSITKALAYELGTPFTATSANITGNEPAYSAGEIMQQFEGQIFQPDIILDAGKLPQYPPSAVIDIRGAKPIIIREGVAKLR